MRFTRTFGPAAVLLVAAGLHAQTSSPGPTTGGTAPAPTSPTTGGRAPSRPLLIFPTDPAATARAAAGTSPPPVFPNLAFQATGVPSALNITDRQRTQIDTLTQQLQAGFQPQYDRLNSLAAAEQAAIREQLNREYLAAWQNAAREVFNAEQLARYQQLQLQLNGFNAFNDPVVQRSLNLDDAQMARLREDITWSQQQQALIQQQAAVDQGRALEAFNAYNTASQNRLNQFLTPEQQQSWAQLTGDRFAFPPMFPAATGAAFTGPGRIPLAPGTTVSGPGGVAITPRAPGTTGPTVTGPNGVPISPGAAGGPTRPAPLVPGAPGPTTGGAARPPVGPTTGGPAPAGGPTTGGTRPAGGPTTGGTAPGGPMSPVPPKM